MIDDTNVTTNYNRYHTRSIYVTVRTLTPERKQRLHDEIQALKLSHTSYDRQMCERIEKLLTKKGSDK